MRITEAAHYLGISINTLKEMADTGRVKSYKTTEGSRKPKTEAESVVLAEIANTSGELDFGGIQ